MEFYYHEIDREVLILSADGGLNGDTAKPFVEQLEKLIEAGMNKIIVDCTNLDFISSSGIATLIGLHKKLSHGGDVKIAAPKSIVLRALTVARIAKILEIYPDVDQARLAFRPKADG